VKGKKMRRLYIAIVLVALCVFVPNSNAKSLFYANDFLRFLHVTGEFASAFIVCHNGKNTIAFQAGPTGHLTKESHYDTFKMFPDYKKFRNEGVPSELIYVVTYSKDYSKKNENWLFINKVSAFHIESDAHVYFRLAGTPLVIHLELADVNMAPIKDGKLPKNSHYTRVRETNSSDGYRVTAPNAVYLWENDATDKKIACDIESTVD
jgi:hypothetical protein